MRSRIQVRVSRAKNSTSISQADTEKPARELRELNQLIGTRQQQERRRRRRRQQQLLRPAVRNREIEGQPQAEASSPAFPFMSLRSSERTHLRCWSSHTCQSLIRQSIRLHKSCYCWRRRGGGGGGGSSDEPMMISSNKKGTGGSSGGSDAASSAMMKTNPNHNHSRQ